MHRILLLQETSPETEARIAKLEEAGFCVIEADSQNLYWNKYVEKGNWFAIIFDHSCFKMISVEFATEYSSSPLASKQPLILVTPKKYPATKLPTPFRNGIQVNNNEQLIEILSNSKNSYETN